LPGGCDPWESLAPPKENALKIEEGEFYHHVESEREVADIYDVIIGYSSSKT
jgi:hypothetical protein